MKARVLKINQKLYYGWVIVLMSGLAFFFSAPGQTYSISVFINTYETVFPFSKTQVSTAYSVATTISGLSLIFMGKLVDRFGQKRMLMIVGSMLALTAFYNSFVSNFIMLFIGFFLLRYFGQGSMTLIPNSLVPQWFMKKRAYAMSLAGIGNLLATLTIPSINLLLIHAFGWENAWRIWSIALLVGFIPLVYFFVFDSPLDANIPMENDENEKLIDANEALRVIEKESFSLRQAVKTRAFWIAGFISMIPSMVTTGITFHFFGMMALRSVSETEAALVIGFVAFPAFFMPFLARLIIDRYPTKSVLKLTLMGVIITMIYFTFFVTNLLTAMIFILTYGSMIAILGVALNVLWPNYYGRKYLGSIRGAATIFMVLGSALGPLPFGVEFDLTGNYTITLIIMTIITLLAFLSSLFIKKPEKNPSL